MKNKIVHTDNWEKNIRQFLAETETWEELLACRMEENVLLKNKLASILKYNYNQNCLEEIEEFQTKFIKEDEEINSLRKAVNLLNKIFEEEKIEKSLDTKIKEIRRGIDSSAKRFCILKSDFNDFQYKIFCKPEN